jgi:effector-binding domain-containing protein
MTTASTPHVEIEEVKLSPTMIVGRRERVAVGDLPAFFAAAIPAVAAELQREGIRPAGPPVAAYRGEIGDTFEVTIGFPVAQAPVSDDLIRLQLPGGAAIQALHAGPYRSLPETYGRLGEWFTRRHLPPPTLMWEEYLVGPRQGGDEAMCVTRVVVPLG